MEVVLIKYKSPYEDFEEIIGVAMNIDAAKKHIKLLEERFPHAYDYDEKRFSFEEFIVIE